MWSSKRLWFAATIAVIYVGCAPVKFAPDIDCSAFQGECSRVDGRVVGKPQAFVMNGGKIDVVFIDDNSASMSYYQKKLADRLQSFIGILDNAKSDYRIAITTTDISSQIDSSISNSPRSANQNGALQDGRLIAFGNGRKFLTPGDSDRLSQFRTAIERSETATCDQFLRNGGSSMLWDSPQALANCVSGDERGIFAANLVVSRNPEGFIREDAVKTVFVGITNEDVRSGDYARINSSTSNYRLWKEDTPQELVAMYRQKYPRKTLEFNTIGILPGQLKAGVSASDAALKIFEAFKVGGTQSDSGKPDQFFTNPDTSCLGSAQSASSGMNVTPGYSNLYSLASLMTGGIQTSLCQEDYGSQLESIAKNSIRNRFYVCHGLAVERAWIGDINNEHSPETVTVSAEDGFARFPDDIEPGTTVNLKFSCAAVRK